MELAKLNKVVKKVSCRVTAELLNFPQQGLFHLLFLFLILFYIHFCLLICMVRMKIQQLPYIHITIPPL